MSEDREQQIQTVANRVGVHANAVCFVLHSLDSFGREMPTELVEPADAAELCWRLHDLALHHYRGSAREVLESWGITSTKVIGSITYELVDEGWILRNAGDRIEDFDDVFAFEDAFQTLHRPPATFMKRWSIRGILIATTIIAVACTGLQSAGAVGALATLTGGWLGLIGVVCLLSAMRRGFEGKPVALGVAAVLITIGIAIVFFASGPDRPLVL